MLDLSPAAFEQYWVFPEPVFTPEAFCQSWCACLFTQEA